MIMLTILLIVGLGLLVSGLSHRSLAEARDKATTDALSQAKEALIGRAVTDANRPGSLPCPDLATNLVGNIPGDGKADLLSGNDCPSYVGWFPWWTLGLPDLRDGYGERLWYAFSTTLRDDDSAQPINSSTTCALAADGMSQVAAVIIAPGPALASQNGRPSNNLFDYLDGVNADGDSSYSAGPASDSFNDRVMVISCNELFRGVSRRVLAELVGTGDVPTYGLRKYYADNGKYPPPAADLSALPGYPPWIADNNWFNVATYTVTPDQSQASISSGATTICTANGLVTTCP